MRLTKPARSAARSSDQTAFLTRIATAKLGDLLAPEN